MSIWPSWLRKVNSLIPAVDPTRPPSRRMPPILKSTLPRRLWESKPEPEAPTTWLEPDATALGEGTPRKKSRNGRGESRERVWKYVKISWLAVSFTRKKHKKKTQRNR